MWPLGDYMNQAMPSPKTSEWYHAVADELLAYAISITRDEDLARDLVQDVLLKLQGGTNLPDEHDAAKRYVFRMLRNQNLDNLRKRKVRSEYLAEAERSSYEQHNMTPNPEDQLAVRDAFDKLGADHREVLFLVDIMGFKYAEAAETMEVPIGTVMSRISRARDEMIRLLRPDEKS